ncbi:hypothetical protein [Streptomyces sp. 11x1]|uniref:hypothetical protein n=1 Tax=Streptomyces sp. 11x1 TaxID=3038642 RepID=UPI002931323C|nr:hypothetical protein [Streptomyces sp. 11x1]WNZ14905.1 hypothetical protein P8T65_46565 [Streptomyces sp. 11x1]
MRIAAAFIPVIVTHDDDSNPPIPTGVDPSTVRFSTLAEMAHGDLIVGGHSAITYASAKAICTNPTATAFTYALWYRATLDVTTPQIHPDGYVTLAPGVPAFPGSMTVQYVPRAYR